MSDTATGNNPIAPDYKIMNGNVDVTAKYTITAVAGTLTINPKAVTVTAKSEAFTYDGTAHSNDGYDVAGLVGDDAISAVVTGSITYVDESPVTNELTSYEFTTGTPGNYSVTTGNGELTMTYGDEIAITITAASQSKTYDGNPLTNSGVSVTSGSLIDGDRLVATATGSATDVSDTATGNNPIDAGYKIMNGNVDVTAKYKITAVAGTLTINPKAVTVTANNKSKVYGTTDPELDAKVDGTLGTDTVTYSVERAQGEDVGTYTITASGAETQGNYTVTYESGTFTITPRPVTLQINSKTYPYDGNPKTVTDDGKEYTVAEKTDNSGLLNDHEITLNVVYGEGANVEESKTYVGSYKADVTRVDGKPQVTITANDGTTDVTSNYDVTVQQGTLEITSENPVIPTKEEDKSNKPTGDYKLGDKIPFNITVQNIMGITLTNVTVADETAEIVAGTGYSVANGVATIEEMTPGQVVVIKALHTVTEEDILETKYVNQAVVIVEIGNEEFKVTGDATAEDIEDPNPKLSVIKTTTSTPTVGDKYQIGDTIAYSITVKNTGNLTIENIKVEDELTKNVGDKAWTIDKLVPQAEQTFTVTYTVTEVDVKNGYVLNKATVNGEGPEDHDPEEAYGEKKDEIAQPDLSLTKSGSVKDVRPGDTFTYTLTLTNKGEGKATSVVVTDKLPEQIEFVRLLTSGMKAEVVNSVLTWNIDEIAGANEDGTATEMTLEFEVKVKSEDVLKDTDLTISNTAKITSQTIPDDTDEATEKTAIARVDVQKSAQILNPDYSPKNGDQASLGDIIRFNVVVTNKGGCELNNVVVSDIMIGKAIAESIKVEPSEAAVFNLGRSAANGSEVMVLNTLPVGQMATFTYDYRVTEEDILKGSVSNVATADAQTENGTEVTGKGETNTTTDKPAPSLTIDKALAPKTSGTERTSYRIGEAIQYLITVTNTGNVTVNNVEVTDYLTSLANPAGKVETIKLAEGVAPGESVTVEYAYTVTGEDVLPTYAEDGETVLKHFVYNYATVEGTGVDENNTLCTAESEMVTAEAEHLVLIRFIDSQTGTVLKGEYIPYGGSLTPPREREVPDYPGYYFDGWWGGIWENAYTDQNIFTNYVRREGWYPPRENDNGTGIIDAEIPLAGGYISNVGDCFD